MDDALTSAGSNPGPRSKSRWTPDRKGFDSLLSALDADRAEAANRYTALRERLSRFFAWNHAEDPDALADETLDRLTRRIASGAQDDDAVREPEKFAAGIARMLLRERWREQKTNAAMLASLELQGGDAPQEKAERQRVEALSVVMDDCLAQLTPEQRDLIERYYSTESRNQMDARKTLAEEFRISLNALRNRAMRIRTEVERCAKSRIEGDSA